MPLQFDPLYYPYKSQRKAVYAQNGMVATSHPLAAQAGLSTLQAGGNAIDAAVAAAAALTVVEPTANGIGGDAFALVWHKDKLYGLNSSGPAPQGLTAQLVKDAGHKTMPKHGWLPVTVPGVPGAWAHLTKRFGRLPLITSLSPAIAYAQEGHPLAPINGYYWQLAYNNFSRSLRGHEYVGWFATFAPEGKAPSIGQMWRSSGHAQTLTKIGDSEGEDFYRGSLAAAIDAFSRKTGGILRQEDLAQFEPEWVDPISVTYRGHQVWEIPPNGQGLIALIALNILNQFSDFAPGQIETYHTQIEALKLGFSQAKHLITDPRDFPTNVEEILSLAQGQAGKKRIGPTALEPDCGPADSGGTVYLATADGEGNMVSYIQSNYMGFGSGIVIPGTGISLQNRGHGFSLDENHRNYLKPGKRTYHTIIPGFLTRDGLPLGPFGVMGGFMQPQGHVQVIMNTLDFHLNPQAALDAPRFQWIQDKRVEVEESMPNQISQALARRGHDIHVPVTSGGFGRGQIIWRTKDGVLVGGTESRTDGCIAAW